MRRHAVLVLAVASLPALPAVGADIRGPVIVQSVKNDVSPPLRELARLVQPAPERPEADVEIPLRIVEGLPPHPEDPHADPVRQTEERPFPQLGVTPPPIINVPGLPRIQAVTPPDTNGDVGRDHYFQTINLSFAIWDKANMAGGPILGPLPNNTMWAGFGGPCENTNEGDPVVFYDHLADRWFFTQFAISAGLECMAVSTSGDPTGSYFRYAFTPEAGEDNDYPKCTLWVDSYLCSYRMFPPDATFAGFAAYDRGAMLVGAPATQVIFFESCGAECPDGVGPVHLEGPPPPPGTAAVFTKDWDDDFQATGAQPDGYRLWELDVDWSNPGAATFTELPRAVSASDWDQDMCGFFVRDCVEQPAPATQVNYLDPIDELQMFRSQYRYWGDYSTIVLNHTIDATGTDVGAPRWVELRDDQPLADGTGWGVFQEGVYQPSTDDRWMGSIAMDGAGNIALGYSISSTTLMPGVRYTARRASDPLGTMPGGEVTLIAGTGVNLSMSNRWGDYSSMSIDPVDDCTFWYTQEWMETTGVSTWVTRIGAFKFDDCEGSPVLFADGFESGTTDLWSTTTN